jgi:rubredoxin---NAD+ reductase
LPTQAASYMQQKLEGAGITFHLATSTLEVERLDENFRLKLASEESITADVVLSAVGLKPRTTLAASASIKVNRGIVVNNILQTNFDDIYALGDCAEVEGKVLPFVMPIMQAARVLAPTLAGKITVVNYPAMPVAVKTPACPVVVSPPEPALQGNWHCEKSNDGVKATFLGESDGILHGFALLGSATAEKSSLVQMLEKV